MSKGSKLIGRTTDFRGKTLWEIVGSLYNYGIGRLVVRNMFQRYPEPCYMRILKVECVPEVPNEARKVRVTVEKTWRGVTLPKPITIYGTSYKPDYELVPIEEEEKYLKNTKKVEIKTLPRKIEFPPLLREYIKDETGEENPMMDVHFKTKMNKFTRFAENNEKPTIELTMDLGKPASPTLYQDAFEKSQEENKIV